MYNASGQNSLEEDGRIIAADGDEGVYIPRYKIYANRWRLELFPQVVRFPFGQYI